MSYRSSFATLVIVLAACSLTVRNVRAQAFGVELHNTMMPASGGMGGTSIARPQDVQSSFLNPATLTQFRGTQFGFGGGWAEPTVTIDNRASIGAIGVDPYSDKSGRPGSALGNIAVSQDVSSLGMPVTLGFGLLTVSGLGIDYRATPESNGTSAELVGLGIASGAGVQLSDRTSVGAAVVLGTSSLDGPFSGIGASVPAYALRGILGVTHDVTDYTTCGLRWITRQDFHFDDAVVITSPVFTSQDLKLDFPETFGLGIANNRLMDGRLLLAADVSYLRWSEADFFRAIWDDQFVLQLGCQYTVRPGRHLRLGYAYAENISKHPADLSIGGIQPPGDRPGIQYIQAQFPAINQHRLTGGIGFHDVLPGVDIDLMAGGMFGAEEAFGDTIASVASYWVGGGLTWRFGRGACCPLPIENDWN